MKYALILLLSLIITAPVQASTVPEPLKIVVVNVDRLMNDSKAGQSIKKQSQKILDKNKDRLEDLVEKVKKTEEKLSQAMKDKDEDGFKTLRQDYREQIEDLQKSRAAMGKDTNKSVINAVQVLKEEIIEIITDMAKKHEYDLVLTGDNVAFVRDRIEITDDVMTKLNKNLSSVTVK